MYLAQLQALGAQVPVDLKDLEERDYDQMGMKVIEKNAADPFSHKASSFLCSLGTNEKSSLRWTKR